MNFGAWLRDRRQGRNMTLAQVAEKSGLTIGFLSELERGLAPARSVGVRTAEQIAVGYGLSLTTIVAKITHEGKTDA